MTQKYSLTKIPYPSMIPLYILSVHNSSATLTGTSKYQPMTKTSEKYFGAKLRV